MANTKLVSGIKNKEETFFNSKIEIVKATGVNDDLNSSSNYPGISNRVYDSTMRKKFVG